MSRVTPDFGFGTATQNKRQRSGLHSTVTLQEHCIFAYSYILQVAHNRPWPHKTNDRGAVYTLQRRYRSIVYSYLYVVNPAKWYAHLFTRITWYYMTLCNVKWSLSATVVLRIRSRHWSVIRLVNGWQVGATVGRPIQHCIRADGCLRVYTSHGWPSIIVYYTRLYDERGPLTQSLFLVIDYIPF